MKREARIPEYHGDGPDDWLEYEAFDAEHAAEKCAEDYYDADQGDANKFDVLVEVREGDAIKRFRVSADYSVNFYAKETSE